ncbi:MAG: Protein oar [Luteibacter sp.]|uniref:TonB-dependent receptor n=1 Tax=Luteibacter sp. TaxID=1886636 RepID=UPI0013817221|nr:TonB-dependent receptor [Luteibacter sp.]KAF1005680.1 MAG: Protein oar [Luteibacter sp.]
MIVRNYRHWGYPRSALAVALGMTLLGGVAHAQSNATGTIFGQAAANSTIVIESPDTGLRREVTAGTDGRYRASSLPVGRYKVSLIQNGTAVETRDNVQLAIGAGTEVSLTGAAASASGASNLEGVSVNASALPTIDVSSTDSRTVFTAQQMQRIPVPRDVTAVALLTPGAVAGDSRYGGVPSFGGSAVSDNAYYINGYAVTNPLTQIGFSSLPFDAIEQEQVLTGGYGAEFGRSTGGVINIVTKRGTNEWKAGAEVRWEPLSLKSDPRNIYYPRTGNTEDGTIYQRRESNKSWRTTYAAYVGGPLIKDKLFIYATGEATRQEGTAAGSIEHASRNNYDSYRYDTPRWLAKADWNITDNHIVEVTGLSDKTKRHFDDYTYDYASGTHGSTRTDTGQQKDGGEVYIGKYTGYITDNFTVTALYGRSNSVHTVTPGGASAGYPYVAYSNAASIPTGQVYNPQYSNYVPSVPGARDKTRGWRLDLEYRLGDHSLRAGIDRQDLESTSGSNGYAGGVYYLYSRSSRPNNPISSFYGQAAPATGGGYGTQGYYVRKRVFNTNASVEVKQSAQYIEDAWQVSDRWLLSLGLRNEQFTNFNGEGQQYVSQRHQLAPRLGVSWDVFGDSTLKVYANAGRYHQPLPNNVAIRGASASLYTNQYFTYTGIDPTNGAPLGLKALGKPYSTNNELGQPKDPKGVASSTLKPQYQDEYILGMQQQINPAFNWGVKFTYRNLRNIIDDFCDDRPIEDWAKRNGKQYNFLFTCALFNPGRGGTWSWDVDGDGKAEQVHLSAADLGFPKPKRRYLSMDTFIEHPFDGKWYGRIDYTLSHSFGNTEGPVLSDIGQSDVSATQSWDYPEIMEHANGNLPNDRRHYLKAYGYYQLTPEWTFGATGIAASGRPKNCIGLNPDPNSYVAGYGSAFFYCDFSGNNVTGANSVAAPRGSQGNLPWSFRLDLNVGYRPAYFDNKFLFQVDVFNVFNSRKVQSINEVHEQSTYNTKLNNAYGRPISFQDPRSVRLTARYDF